MQRSSGTSGKLLRRKGDQVLNHSEMVNQLEWKKVLRYKLLMNMRDSYASFG